MTFDEVMAFRSLPGMRFRTRPPRRRRRRDRRAARSTCRSPASARQALATKTFKFTVTGPHMLAKTLLNRHYADTPELAHAIADVLAEQVQALDADVVQLDEANLPGHPEEWEWAAVGDQPRARCREDDAGGAPVLRQLRRPERPARHLGSS